MNYAKLEVDMTNYKFEDQPPLIRDILKRYWYFRNAMFLEWNCPNFSVMMFEHAKDQYEKARDDLLRIRSFSRAKQQQLI